MSSVQHLREFIGARLTAAAEEIFSEFEKTIVQYKEEIDRQRKLLDITWNPQIKLHRTDLPQQHVHENEEKEVLADQQLGYQEKNSSLDQDEFPAMKEEQEEPCTRQEGVQLLVKQETDDFTSAFTFQESDFTAEPKTDLLSSNNSTLPENQDQEGNKFVELEPSRGTKTKPKLRRRRNPSPVDDGRNSPVSEGQFDSEASEKVLSLATYTRTRKVGNQHPCEKCGKYFMKKYLTTHMRMHTGEKPFSCPICGKSFSTSSYFNVHKRIHTGEKLFSCERCGKGFTCKSNMLTHMRTHTGVRPFSCKICGKSFTQKGSLSIHMRTHSGERPHSKQNTTQ